jgi:hypothetical protein
VLLAIFIGCAVTQFLAAGDIRALMIDTDALNIPNVVDNVMAHSGSLSRWYLSPAPYLFPDALIHAIIHPLTSSTYVRLAVFAAIQIALLFALVWWLAVRTLRQRPLAIAVAITGNLVFTALLRGGPFNQLMTAGFHYGAFLISIAVVVLALTTQRRSNWVVIAVLCFLTSLSDNIFIIQTAVPLAVTLLLVALFDAELRWHRAISACVVAASSLLGSLMYGVFITYKTRYPIHYTSEKFRSNAHAVKLILRDFASNHEPIAAAVLLSGVIGLFYVVRLMKRIRRTTPIAIVSIFAFGSVVSTCFGLVLATTNEMTIRYFIPVFTWPLIVCGLILFNTDMLREKVPVLVATLTAIVLCVNTSTLVDTHGIERDYYPADVACIDNALPNLSQLHGMSNYWDAKYIQSFSKRDLTVAQYWDNLTPMKWITTDDYYRSSYDFAVISTNMPPQFTLSRELLEKTFGQPTTSVTCGSRIVLVFQRGA